MTVKKLTDHHLEFLSLKGGCKARLSLHMSKCHIVGNHMSRLNYRVAEAGYQTSSCTIAMQGHSVNTTLTFKRNFSIEEPLTSSLG